MSGRHAHFYSAITTFVDGHDHFVRNITAEAFDVPGHTHFLPGMTSMNDGHEHPYAQWTGPEIPIGTGQHVHYFSVYTSVVEGHNHFFAGYTEPA